MISECLPWRPILLLSVTRREQKSFMLAYGQSIARKWTWNALPMRSCHGCLPRVCTGTDPGRLIIIFAAVYRHPSLCRLGGEAIVGAQSCTLTPGVWNGKASPIRYTTGDPSFSVAQQSLPHRAYAPLMGKRKNEGSVNGGDRSRSRKKSTSKIVTAKR